jgi:hypothetical protein
LPYAIDASASRTPLSVPGVGPWRHHTSGKLSGLQADQNCDTVECAGAASSPRAVVALAPGPMQVAAIGAANASNKSLRSATASAAAITRTRGS